MVVAGAGELGSVGRVNDAVDVGFVTFEDSFGLGREVDVIEASASASGEGEFVAGTATDDFTLRASSIIAASSMSVAGRPAGGGFNAVGSGAAPFLVNGTSFPESGGSPVVSTFRITNIDDTVDLLFGLPELAGPNAAEFSIDGFTTAPLAPGATRDFTVTFNSAFSTERTATITFLSNDLNIRNFEINLLGNAPEESEINPAIIGFKISGRDAEFTLVTNPAKTYRLRRSSVLAKLWEDVPGVVPISGSTVSRRINVPDLIDPRIPRYFYRIEELSLEK